MAIGAHRLAQQVCEATTTLFIELKVWMILGLNPDSHYEWNSGSWFWILLDNGHLRLEQGAVTKRMTAIEEMAGMDVLCSD